MADFTPENVLRDLERFAARTVVALALNTEANLIETTPVDTGWARANWIASLDYPTDVVDGGPGESGVRGSHTASGAPSVSEIIGAYEWPHRIWLSNNVPYIRKLNEGHSKQAPAGFVQKAVDKASADDISGIGIRVFA